MNPKRKKPEPMVISATRPPWHEAHRWWLATVDHGHAWSMMDLHLDGHKILLPEERDALARHIQLTRPKEKP